MIRQASILFALLLPISSVNAALMTFDSRESWLSALGAKPDISENFNSITADEIYLGGPSKIGFLTFEATGNATNKWRIDAPNNAFTEFAPVDNSAFAIVAAMDDGNGPASSSISFDPLRAIGFDYSRANLPRPSDGLLTTSLGDQIKMSSNPATRVNFLGLVYDKGESFTSLSLSALGNFGFGMDNVEVFEAVVSADNGIPAPNPVPLPAAFWLFGSALLGLFGRNRAKLRARA